MEKFEKDSALSTSPAERLENLKRDVSERLDHEVSKIPEADLQNPSHYQNMVLKLANRKQKSLNSTEFSEGEKSDFMERAKSIEKSSGLGQ